MRRTFTILWAFALAFVFTTSYFAQDKAQIKQLIQKYENGVQLNKAELELIEDIIHPQTKNYLYAPNTSKGSLSEGFEDATFPPSGWTTINNDGGTKEWERYTSDAHSGSACAAVGYETPNDDWLITPQITVATGDMFSFWAKSGSSSWLEDYNVLVSKTGNAVGDFTITLDQIRGEANAWTQHEYNLVGGGYGINDGDNIYIAIQCVSDDELRLLIDDVSVYNSATKPGDPSNPNPADNATNVAYASGTLTWDFGANTDQYSLMFGPAGNMSEVVTNASTSGGSGSYSYSNLNTGTEYEWQVIAKNSSTGETTNGPVWSFTTSLPADMYQVGSGTNTGKHLPIEPYYGYTYSQTIYLASDLSSVGSNKRISKIYYNYTKSSSNDHDADDWVIYIGTTHDASISDWIDVSTLTKVFDGNSGFGDIAPGDGWMEIILETPFNYDPSTDGNLVVAVDENSSSYTSTSDDFYCDQNTTKANVSIYYYNDSTNPDPASPPSGTTSSYYPNIRFQFEDIPAGAQFSVNPESKDFGTVYLGETSSSQTFTVTNTGQGTLQITATTITGTNSADFTLTDGNTYPVNLTNGQSMTVSVTFSPSAEGARSATLRFTADAKVDHDVALSGTGHNATVTSFPYTENFDAAAALPTDWQQDPNNSEDWKFGTKCDYGASSDHTSGSGNIAYVDDSTPHTTDPINLLTPPFDITGLTTPTVSFYYWIGRGNGRDSKLHIDVYDGSTWHEDVITALGENGQWDKVSFDISAYKSTGTKIRFRGIEDPDDYDSDISIDDFRLGEPVQKYVNSITVTQASTANALVGSSNKEILKMAFSVEGDAGSLPLNSITVTGVNTDDNDVTAVKLYRTATGTFATDNLVASGTFAKGAVTFSNINYDLPVGNTYFWVAYDISSSATVGNTVDAKILANGIDVNGTTYNSADDDPTGSRTISGIALSAVTVTQASTADVSIGSSNNEILRIFLDTGESTTSGGTSVNFTQLNVTTKNTDDADVTAVKLYKTTGTTFSTDNLVASGTIGKGSVTFDLTESLTADAYYWVTYDISSSASDGNTVDALIQANGMTISGSTYNADADDPAGERQVRNYNHGGNGNAYGGYYYANSTTNGGPNRPTFEWIDISTTGTDVYGDLSGGDGYAGGTDGYDFGFSFPFFGNTYTKFWIAADGFISLGSDHDSYNNQNIPSTTTPNDLIAVFWDDLNPSSIPSGGLDPHIYYQTYADKVVITYEHVYDYGAGDSGGWITAQAILFSNGTIKLQYKEHGSSMDLASCTVGIENNDGTVALNYLYNGTGGPLFDNTKESGLALQISQNESATPVELSSFVATIDKEGAVELKWTTATEVNTAMFEVERSVAEENGEVQWETIATVEASGNSNSPKEYSYKDELSRSGKYNYRLKMIDLDGQFKYSNIVEVTANIVLKYELSQNYPNPFNPTTTIKYSLKKGGKVNISVYNALGQKVTELVNKVQEAGKYKVKFNASNLASGVYFYRIQSGDFVAVKKMLLLK